MIKVFDLPEYDKNGEPTVKVIDGSFDKLAYPLCDAANSFIANIVPEKNHIYLYVNALGYGEYWGCFPEDAKVLMANGSFREIPMVKPGDKVVTHKARARSVTEIFSKGYSDEMYEFEFISFNHPLRCTKNHPILVVRKDKEELGMFDLMSIEGEWVAARDVKEGDYMKMIPHWNVTNDEVGETCGYKKLLVRVKKIKKEYQNLNVYNLEVEEDNSYCVNGICVHNSNNNGDYFPEADLLAIQSPSEAAKNGPPLENTPVHRYKTFLQAHAFKHHVNKDPKLACGKIIFSYNNPEMKRVEIIADIDRSKAPEIADRIERGISVATSMGCFLKGSKVKMIDGRDKNIEDVIVGESVINRYGNVTKVTETHKRNYKGSVSRISVLSKDPIMATSDHLFLVMPIEKVKRMGRKQKRYFPANSINIKDAEWRHASCLKKGDYLIEPINKDVITPDFITKSMARLLGYYLAEGHIFRNKKKENMGIQLTAHKDDDVVKEIYKLCSDVKTMNEPVIRERRNSSKAVAISICDKKLADFCEEHAGSYAESKYLSESFMVWDQEFQIETLGAYFNGDGCQIKYKYHKGSGIISTASSELASQILIVLGRCGIIGSVNYIRHRPSPNSVVKINTFEYQIYIGKSYINKLVDFSKVEKLNNVIKKNVKMIINSDYIISPIKECSIVYDEYDGDVYNLEVENSESYLINSSVVHNCKIPNDFCSICGNKAKNRNEYCDHLKYHMNEVFEDGRKVYAINRQPRFFDNSFVMRGADKTAGSLLKVASAEVISSAENAEKLGFYEKKSDINKQIDSVAEPADTMLDKMTDSLSSADPAFSRSSLGELSFLTPGQAMLGLRDYGIVLTVPETTLMIKMKMSRCPGDSPTSSLLAGEARDPSGVLMKAASDIFFQRSVIPEIAIARSYQRGMSKTADVKHLSVGVGGGPVSSNDYMNFVNLERNVGRQMDLFNLAPTIDRTIVYSLRNGQDPGEVIGSVFSNLYLGEQYGYPRIREFSKHNSSDNFSLKEFVSSYYRSIMRRSGL